MKRRKLMRLLAVAMAVSVAVTSQGIPAGLTAVYASTSTGVTVTTKTALEAGHLYQSVTATPHSHDSNCYTNTSATTAGENNYFKEIQCEDDNYFTNSVSGTAGTDKVKIGSKYYQKVASTDYIEPYSVGDDVPAPANVLGENYIVKDITDTETGKYKVYSGTVLETAATIHEVEQTRLKGEKVYYPVVWLTTSADYQTNSTYESGTETTAGSGEINLNNSSPIKADGYYEITEWVKVASGASGSPENLAGAIKVADSASKSAEYTALNGITAVSDNEVFVPLKVKAYDITKDGNKATAGDGNKVTYSGTDYYAVKDTSGVITWASGLNAETIDACYTVKATGIFLQVVTPATLNSNIEHNSYTYDKIYLNSGSVATASGTEITSGEIIKKGEDYYIDVTANYVTKIAAAKTTVQYVAANDAGTNLDDSVTLTLGMGATATTETVKADDVTNDYQSTTTYTGQDSDKVKIKTVKGSTEYMYAKYDTSAAGQIITGTTNVGKISAIDDLSTPVTGLDTTSASFKVKTVTAPTMTLSTVTGTADTAISGTDAYDATTVNVVVAKPTFDAPEDVSNWTFKWKDVINTTEKTTYSDPMTYAQLADYTVTNSSLGKNEVSLVAYYNGQEIASSDTKTFYVLKQVDIKAAVTYAALSSSAESEREIVIADLLTPYKDGNNFADSTGGFTATPTGKISNNTASFVGESGKVTYTIDGAAAEDTVTITGTLKNTKYIVNVTIPITVKANGTTISNPTLTATTIYYKDTVDVDTLLGKIITGYTKENKSDYTVTYGESKDVPTAVGNTIVYVSYAKDSAIGSASTTLTVAKKPLTITAKAQTIKKGGSVSQTEFTVASTAGDEVSSSTLPSGLKATAKITTKTGEDVTSSVSSLAIGTYNIEYVISGDDADNYDITTEKADLTIEKNTSTSTGTPTSTDKKDETTDGSGSTTTTGAKIEVINGVKKIVDANGDLVISKVVTIDGKMYYANASGKMVTGKVLNAKGTGAKYYAKKNGELLVSGSAVYYGDRYVAGADGKLVKSGLSTTAKGYTYFLKDYKVVVNKKVKYNGKYYIATKSGKIAKGKKFATINGNKYYVGKTGVVATNKVVTVNGKKYVAQKSGLIAISKKYTIGKKTYTTDKKGVIIKTTTKK